jgi:hypothetical protein
MAISIAAKFYQHAAGADLQAQSTDTFSTAAEWGDENDDGFGVKATNAAPTNISDFGGHTILRGSASMARDENSNVTLRAPGDTIIRLTTRLKFSAIIPLDANWVAGHYVFAFTTNGDGDVVKASPPYRIR